MSAGAPSLDPPLAPVDAPPASAWVHRTAAGVSVGGEEPGRGADNAVLAFGRALAHSWRVRRTLGLLVGRDFKARYRAQALGLLWSFANPLVMMGVMTFVFVKIMNVQEPFFPVFFLMGQLLWQFFNNSVTAGTASLVDNTQIVKRTIHPRQLIPVAAVLSQFLNLVMESLILLVFIPIFPDAFHLSPWLLMLPLILAIQVLMLFGVAMLTSVLNVLYRDMFYVVNSGLLVLFWMSPVIYSAERVPAWLRPYMALNPLTGVIGSVRRIVMQGQAPDPRLLLPSAASALVLFVVGAMFFRRYDRVVADYL